MKYMIRWLVLWVLSLSACGFLEPTAAERTFKTADLLIGVADMPLGYSSYEPFSSREFSCAECASVQFPKLNSTAVATMDVFRYLRTGAAQRLFDEVILVAPHLYPETPWDYQSAVADKTYFGCFELNEKEAAPVCQWVGLYEEFIVVFRTLLGPDGMSLNEMKNVVQTIDQRLADHLKKSLPVETSVP
jgi:hypothetical protein